MLQQLCAAISATCTKHIDTTMHSMLSVHVVRWEFDSCKPATLQHCSLCSNTAISCFCSPPAHTRVLYKPIHGFLCRHQHTPNHQAMCALAHIQIHHRQALCAVGPALCPSNAAQPSTACMSCSSTHALVHIQTHNCQPQCAARPALCPRNGAQASTACISCSSTQTHPL